jgi:hypothetical protein
MKKKSDSEVILALELPQCSVKDHNVQSWADILTPLLLSLPSMSRLIRLL